MDYTALHNEIVNDPASLGYAASVTTGSDAGVAALLNAQSSARISRGVVTTEVFLADMAAQIKAIRSDNPAGVKAAFAPLWDLLTIVRTVDYAHATVQNALAGMVTYGIGGLTTAQVSTITTRPCSRAETLWGSGVSISSNDISFALRGA